MSTQDAVPHLFDFGALGQGRAVGATQRNVTAAPREERSAKGNHVRQPHGEAEAIRVMHELWALSGYARG